MFPRLPVCLAPTSFPAPPMHAGGSPFACACAALLPDRVQALVLVCPLMPTAGREEQLIPGGQESSLRASLPSKPAASRSQPRHSCVSSPTISAPSTATGHSPTTLRLFHAVREQPLRLWATLHMLRFIQACLGSEEAACNLDA